MFDAEKFLSDNYIPSDKKNKWASKGWVQIRCPFCTGHRGWHGGFNIEAGYYNCRRCGYHWMPKVIATLLSISIPATDQIINKYSSDFSFTTRHQRSSTDAARPSQVSFPPATSQTLTPHHRRYLISRRFNPDELKIKWNLMSTGHIGAYSHRILAPIYFNGKVVSYQCRATRTHQKLPYLACAKREEVIEHKSMLYGFDVAVRLNKCVVVEGVTDVWRLGPGAVATFGKGFTPAQVLLISNHFDQIFVLPDSDVPESETITPALEALGKEVEELNLSWGDPDDLSQKQADELMKELGF